MDNGKQFDNAEFREYCDNNSIELCFTSIAHPQANGKAEVANRINLDGLKKRAEVVVPLKTIHGSPRVEGYEAETNKEGRRLALDLIDEVRNKANTRNAEHQGRASFYYN
ncbi:uncharacterized protein LOC141724804 [Apium graveolens]|uniref:uncharacterized protein LOC141724804 n=1 Tax=Apium graveolens TaxID=4045 RepID=UPI003D7A7A18